MIDEQKSYNSLQELFNDMFERIIKQGKPSVVRPSNESNESNDNCYICQYRSENGACAVGIVLSDKTVSELNLLQINVGIPSYDSNESLIADDEEVISKIVSILLPTTDETIAQDFISSMQSAHDDAVTTSYADTLEDNERFIEQFKKAAHCVAESYNLVVP